MATLQFLTLYIQDVVMFYSVTPIITGLTLEPDSFTLTCTTTGSPATTVTWMKDGSPLDIDGTTYSMEQNVTVRANSTYDSVLTINDGNRNDLGTYSCEVQNALGTYGPTVVDVSGKFTYAPYY